MSRNPWRRFIPAQAGNISLLTIAACRYLSRRFIPAQAGNIQLLTDMTHGYCVGFGLSPHRRGTCQADIRPPGVYDDLAVYPRTGGEHIHVPLLRCVHIAVYPRTGGEHLVTGYCLSTWHPVYPRTGGEHGRLMFSPIQSLTRSVYPRTGGEHRSNS